MQTIPASHKEVTSNIQPYCCEVNSDLHERVWTGNGLLLVSVSAIDTDEGKGNCASDKKESAKGKKLRLLHKTTAKHIF